MAIDGKPRRRGVRTRGKPCRELRWLRGVRTQSDAADLTGLGEDTIRKIESGQGRVWYSSLLRYLETFGVSPERASGFVDGPDGNGAVGSPIAPGDPPALSALWDAYLRGDPAALAKTDDSDRVRQLIDQYRSIFRGDFDELARSVTRDVTYQWHLPPCYPHARGSALLTAEGRDRVLARVADAFRIRDEAMIVERIDVETLASQGGRVILVGLEEGRCREVGAPRRFRFLTQLHFEGNGVRSVRIDRLGEVGPPAAASAVVDP